VIMGLLSRSLGPVSSRRVSHNLAHIMLVAASSAMPYVPLCLTFALRLSLVRFPGQLRQMKGVSHLGVAVVLSVVAHTKSFQHIIYSWFFSLSFLAFRDRPGHHLYEGHMCIEMPNE
jgi:hypothetical protein